MKKFLITILAVAVVSLAVLLGTYYFGMYKIKKAWNFKLEPEQKTLVVGNSSAEAAVDDAILDTWANRCKSGEYYLQSISVMREFLNANEQIDTVLITAGVPTLFGYTDAEFAKSKIDFFNTFMSVVSIANAEELKEYENADKFKYFRLTAGYNLLMGEQRTRGFIKINRRKLAQASAERERIAREQGTAFPLEQITDSASMQVRILYRMINDCMERGVECVLLTTPLYHNEDYFDKDGYIEFVSTLDPRVLVADYSNFQFPDTSYYADVIHVNAKGGEYFSNYIKEHGLNAVPLRDYVASERERLAAKK